MRLAKKGEKCKTLDEKEYLLLPNVFRDEICSGLDHKNVIRVLSNQKWFVTDNDGKHAQQNIRHPGVGQKRCYVFSSKEWAVKQIMPLFDPIFKSRTYRLWQMRKKEQAKNKRAKRKSVFD